MGYITKAAESAFHILLGTTIVDFGAAAGTNIVLGFVNYAKWRVAGIGWRCHTEVFTAGEDPEMTFGSAGDADFYGKIKVTFPAGQNMVVNDVASYDNLTPDFLGWRIAMAETGITFTAGDPDGSTGWQIVPSIIYVENVAQLTTGQGYPFALIEVSRV